MAAQKKERERGGEKWMKKNNNAKERSGRQTVELHFLHFLDGGKLVLLHGSLIRRFLRETKTETETRETRESCRRESRAVERTHRTDKP